MSASDLRKGLVVSDLHLFAPRSEGAQLFDQLAPRLAETDLLVLNGDTFDFQWSHHSTASDSIAAAVDWLKCLVDSQPHQQIHYLLGNHDCITGFRTALETLASSETRLHWHEHQLHLGETLFLHGDCANWWMDAKKLERSRERWSQDTQRGPTQAAFYRVADALDLGRRFHEWYFPAEGTVKRVAHHLDHVLPDWPEKISHCYFGHTHRPFHDFSWRGVRFSNTGSGIRGMGFQPLEFTWNPAIEP